ncbi:MAG: hypothetical protein A3G33_03880 [Omnitrophica bacterium RIFCSPLOWO2_12_FULL_44_17]|uniref:MgtC/SapB/SrpB/YhiD N-terminal domain-containing protein n=1 Tax=Candidatus Danuiimicrobium aquiferis TaxID=1801832 RepID=A0A1G1KSL7_9BACT|nr:MAG: hypothetical protein A3B72_02140 [Omnitrophica bacterium RIFCSPHIGHO2_02_FULL_45_28]OGW95918.1 MAG: hypothetical protein A3G33_03880 [Omnitrophica bacterium RIFCSPLOWO2_12_FULL_44_17]OGX01917.1 MAG: hypothetical protein A3J12_05295 [Omnitrophica bacterium RIFCSPLOWO2_02_FULL_44_11]
MESMATYLEIFARLGIAALFGGLIGFERDLHHKIAGFRTYSVVSLGSALIMLVSLHIFEIYHGLTSVDPGRIAAQVVAGVGFLGAGTIIRDQTHVKGLTTAAGIWLASGIGLACGLGYFGAAAIATVMSLFVLVVFSYIGRKMGSRDV